MTLAEGRLRWREGPGAPSIHPNPLNTSAWVSFGPGITLTGSLVAFGPLADEKK